MLYIFVLREYILISVASIIETIFDSYITNIYIYKQMLHYQGGTYILKPSCNRSPYIFTLVQKVKNRVYKIHAFLNNAILCQDSAKLSH